VTPDVYVDNLINLIFSWARLLFLI